MYKLTNTTTVVRLVDGAIIPDDANNRDYTTYLVWLSEGNIPESAESLTPIQKINEIESANPVTHRMLRDLIMSVAEIAATIIGVDPFVNPSVQRVVDIESQIAKIRSQINTPLSVV